MSFKPNLEEDTFKNNNIPRILKIFSLPIPPHENNPSYECFRAGSFDT